MPQETGIERVHATTSRRVELHYSPKFRGKKALRLDWAEYRTTKGDPTEELIVVFGDNGEKRVEISRSNGTIHVYEDRFSSSHMKRPLTERWKQVPEPQRTAMLEKFEQPAIRLLNNALEYERFNPRENIPELP